MMVSYQKIWYLIDNEALSEKIKIFHKYMCGVPEPPQISLAFTVCNIDRMKLMKGGFKLLIDFNLF